MMNLELDPETGVGSVSLVGKIYASDANKIKQRLLEQVANGCKSVVIDCSRLEQIDSTIIAALIAVRKKICEAGGGTIVFAGANEHIRRILNMTKVDTICAMAADMFEAKTVALDASGRQ